MSRKGTQPSNPNVLQHGYYSRRFKQVETSDLDQGDNLTDEIAFMRIHIRRISEYLEDNMTKLDPADLIRASRALSYATSTLANLLRTQSLLGSNQPDELTKALQDALMEVTRELKL